MTLNYIGTSIVIITNFENFHQKKVFERMLLATAPFKDALAATAKTRISSLCFLRNQEGLAIQSLITTSFNFRDSPAVMDSGTKDFKCEVGRE